MLKRAIRTMWIVLDELDQMWLPVHKSWRLNERHYGSLQGLNKAETAEKHGEEQARSYPIVFRTSSCLTFEINRLRSGADPMTYHHHPSMNLIRAMLLTKRSTLNWTRSFYQRPNLLKIRYDVHYRVLDTLLSLESACCC